MKQLLHRFALTLLLFPLGLSSLWACDGSGYIMNNLVDNGDGTWTLDMTIYVAGGDWAGGILGGTQGFYFSTDAPNILSVSPASITSLNGTTLTGVITGPSISWGTPGVGPYFVQDFEPTQTFDVTLILDGEPSQWAGGGMEENGCPGGPGTSNPSPGYSGTFNFYTPPPLCENMPNLPINDNSTVTDMITVGGASGTLGAGTTIEAICVLLEHTYIGDLEITLTAPNGNSITLSDNNGGSTNNYGVPSGGTYMCFTATALLDVTLYPGNDGGAWLPEDGFDFLDGGNPNGDWTLSVTDQVGGDQGTFLSWGIALSNGSCGCEAPTISLPALDPVCAGEPLTINAFVTGDADISWSDGSTGETIVIFPTEAGSITATASNACGEVSASTDIAVNDLPVLVPPPNVQACAGENITVTADIIGADYVNWSTGDVGNTLSYTTFTSETIFVTAGNACGEVSETFDLTIDPLPTLTPIGSDPFICAGQAITLSVSALDADEIIWSNGDTGESTIVSPAITTTYTIMANNSCGSVESSITVFVEAPPELSWISGDQTICQGQTAVLEVNATDADVINWSTGAQGDAIIVSPVTTTTYDVTALNSCGEASLQATLMVEPPQSSELTLSTCPGSTIMYGGVSLAPGETADVVLTSSNGCDSIVTVTVVPDDLPPVPVTLSVCPGDTLYYQNTPLLPGDIQDFLLLASNGCDSLVTVTVTAAPTYADTLQLQTCPSDTVFYAGTALLAGDTMDFSLLSALGCDSIVTVMVEALPVFTDTLDLMACPGDTVFYAGASLLPGDQQAFTLTAANGCDSVVTVNVQMLETFSSSLTLTTCMGIPVMYQGVSLPPGAVQDFTLQASNGCDSVVTVTVEEVDDLSSTLELMTCPNGTVDYNGTILAPGDIQDFLLSSVNGCDSTVTVTVSALPTFTSNETLYTCPGSSVSYAGMPLMPGAVETFVFTALNGCDSTVTVTVEALPTFSSNLALEACTGSSVSYNGTDLPAGSQQDFTLVAANGCDSIVSVTVTELPTFASELFLSSCPGESVNYNGTDLLPGDMQTFTLQAVNGCDSLVTVMVEELPTFSSALQLMACPGEAVSYNGTDLLAGETQTFSLQALNGCDSLVTVTVEALPTFSSELQLMACPGEAVSYNGTSLLAGETQTFSLQAANGCDSLVTVTVETLPTFSSELQLMACPGEAVSYNGTNLLPGETQTFNLQAVNGCDSLVTVFVEILNIPEENLSFTICEGMTQPYAGEALPVGAAQTFTFTGANGCDSLVYVSVAGWPTYAETLQVQACEGGTYNYAGTAIPAGGTQVFNFQTVTGCDSTITVQVAEVANLLTTASVQACAGDSVLIFGQYEHSAGTYSTTYTSQQGCDSTHQITLQLLAPPAVAITTDASCQDQPTGQLQASAGGNAGPYQYDWSDGGHGDIRNGLAAGTYALTVTDAQGCQSSSSATVPAHELALNATVTPISCYGDANGIIQVEAGGGQAVFRLGASGPFQQEGVFTNLPPGYYEVEAEDNYGCRYRLESVFVEEPEELLVYLPADTTIKLGDSLRLPALSNRPPDELIYSWRPGEDLSCNTCYMTVAKPYYSTHYFVSVADGNGCTAEDDIRIIVDRRRSVYIPNGFSPNGDGTNDLFYIFTDESVREIRSLQVFNRWGESVFENYHFQPNNPTMGWNGTFRGQTMNPAVFVYYAEIEFIDGEVVLFKGDVTLVR
ncbi:MAG: gliding motility-associated C-terminal domain-containing protein [Lewinella sp.]|nr:gliding motility-associated C-terminal domain-containing protein [Lewinella sp.]